MIFGAGGSDTAMRFIIEERQAWVRTSTHTLVFDRDPDFPRFSRDPSGSVKKLYRVWIEATPRTPKTYLGSARLCADGWSFGELTRMFRRVSRYANGAGIPSRGLRLRLADRLRGLSFQGSSAQ